MAVKAPEPHWVRQGRGEDGRFETFRDADPAPAAEPASWLNKGQRRRLEKEMPRRYQPDAWGGSELYDKALEALRRGENHDDIWRKYGAIDPVPGRSPNAFVEEDGRPLLYAPDKDWRRQDGLNLIGRDGFKSGYDNEGPLNLFLQGDPLGAQQIGDIPTRAVKNPNLPRGTSRGETLFDRRDGEPLGINVEAGNLVEFGQVLRHEADHAGIRMGMLESGHDPFGRPGDPPGRGAYTSQDGVEVPNTFNDVFYRTISDLRRERGENPEPGQRHAQKSRLVGGYAYSPEEFRVLQGDQLARLPQGTHKDVTLSRMDPVRMDAAYASAARLSPEERARVISIVRQLGPGADIAEVRRHLGLPVPGDARSTLDGQARLQMRPALDE
ncbi:MAG: hypothetical protein E6Q97_31110 [Desulfurellales bacterium]|nr:MAG: hypothetical protein E6Q97_31110 [Desulfurellales bacterium]